MGIREEFRLKKLWCNELRTERFCVFQWRSPGIFFLVYRIAVAAYTLTWLIKTAIESKLPDDVSVTWGSFLTNWTYTLLTIYFLLHALIALVVYLLCRGSGLQLMRRLAPEQHRYLFHELGNAYEGFPQDPEERTPLTSSDDVHFELGNRVPWYFALLWVIFNAVSVSAIMVTIVFWCILFPGSGLHFDMENVQLHLVNSVLVLLEHAVTALPVRILHVIYPIIYGLIYMAFSLFYWVDDHSHVMYPILDWGKPGPTVGYVLLVGFVIMPIIQLLIYGFYRLRLAIYRRVSQN
ncbi:uncharacterized protein LOC101853781 [Aplysia californica]|uniref:Uncharacterized protein LOC101853781 n=1 Tax=Aplysia californica TaxID=6500 RepID=A0ABM0JL37_APLCA|nr:uncharacterized protein LOC101853781 [Aplysia californica]XP_005096246.1 uncharacterized protein LOC101853781 [Aplysia californica]XP_035825066.1 uncharacterized protein LOC101853781 [Aplysia californica]